MRPCIGRGPYSTALRTPVQGVTGCGAFQRSGPTGGAAYGMPLNTRTSALLPAAPDTKPPSVFAGSVIAADAAVAAASNVTTLIRRVFMALLPSGCAIVRARRAQH